MITLDNVKAYANGKSKVSSTDENGSASGAAEALASRMTRAKRTIAELPQKVEKQVRDAPYASIAIACGVGVVAGVLLGSRILRALVVGIASQAAIELGSAYLRRDILPKTDVTPAAA